MKILSLLALAALCHPAVADNILRNPDMELGGRTSAVGWNSDIREGSYEFLIAGDARSGERCLAIRAAEDTARGWARWYTTDVFLLEGALYGVSAWVRTEGDALAELWIPAGDRGFKRSVTDADEWTEISGEFAVESTGRHGLYLQSWRGGTVHFDDVSIEMIAAPPAPEPGAAPTDGEPLVAIVTPDAVGPHHGYLALEARRIIEQMTGGALPITAASAVPPDDDARRLWIGVAPPNRNYAPQLAEVGEEGIVLDIGPEAVVCLGNTPRGVYYAVHEFFHLLGCRWAWPGPLGEVIPRVERLELSPPRMAVHGPSFDLRGGHTIQVYHTPPDWKPGHVNIEQWVDWSARNRMNRIKASYTTTWDYGAIRGGQWTEVAGHTLYTILPPKTYFAEHPEYYTLVGGERTHLHSSGRASQVCVANPDLPHIIADWICEYFDNHPDARRVAVNAEDEPSYWCECEDCKALDTVELDWEDNGIRVMDLTDRWLFFINRIAELVEQRHPDRWIVTFAYGSTRELPRRHFPRRNVMIELTWWDQCFKHAMTDPGCEVNAKGMERFLGWSRLAGLSLYRYLDYRHMEAPGPYLHSEADILRTTHAAGCRHLSDEWDTTFNASPLLLNLRARLAWDVTTDVEAFIDDFCGRVYGSAGPAVARYWRRMEQAVREAPAEHVRFNDMSKFTPEVLRDGHALLDEAEALADDEDIRARVDRLRYSLLFAELDITTAAAAEDPALYARQAEIQERLWGIVQERAIEPILGYFGRLGTEYRPPVEAMRGRRVMQLPEHWLFRTDPNSVGEEQGWFAAEPDEAWRTISIHSPWEEQGHPGYDGYGWYTVAVEIPPIPEPRVWLYCEAVDETFKLWINGEYVGASEGDPAILWDKPVAVEITGRFRPGETNRITMRVHDSAYAGGIWKPVWITAG